MRSPFASLNWGRPMASKRAVYRLRLTDTSVEENMDEITFAEAGVEEYYFDNLLDVLRLARARFHQINEGYLEEAGYEEAFDSYLEDFTYERSLRHQLIRSGIIFRSTDFLEILEKAEIS